MTIALQDAGDGGDCQVSEKQMRAAFDLFDLDGSGEISAGEFGTVVRSLGENPTDEEVEAMLKVCDAIGRLHYVV